MIILTSGLIIFFVISLFLTETFYQFNFVYSDPIKKLNNPIISWNKFIEQSIDADKLKSTIPTYPPPSAARIFALVHAAIYDALVYSSSPSSPDNEYNNKDLPQNSIIAGAASQVLSSLFPDQIEKIELFKDLQLANIKNFDSDKIIEGEKIGKKIGKLISIYLKTDGSEKQFNGIIPVGPCMWKGIDPSAPMAGSWKTMLLNSTNQFSLPPPYPCNSQEDKKELDDTIKISKNRTPQQGDLARLYGDETSHIWMYLLNEKITKYNLTTLDAARAHAYLQAAMYDTYLTVWNYKYIYWLDRPDMRYPQLNKIISTPNFPAYPSGHSTVSAAAAIIMGELFPEEKSEFSKLAEDVASSRFWGGVHWKQDNEQGLLLGKKIGSYIITEKLDLSSYPELLVNSDLKLANK
jgi:PAP2 superfamily